MLSPKAIYDEIFSNDEAFRLFCSIAASGEAQGGWENGRIAAMVPESFGYLAPKIARHGADEDKHGRIFNALLRKRNLSPAPVPADTDYTMRLERMGIGVAHGKLRAARPLTEADIVAYLAHSRVTEQRAAEQMRSLRRYSTGNADVSRAITVISADEDNHLAYCQEELLRLVAAGHGQQIESVLRATARAEIAVYRDVSKAVMAHRGRMLNWSRGKSAVLAIGIDSVYLYERFGGWRRMVTLRMPARPDPLGTPASARAHRGLREVPVERAAELQAQHRGDLVEFEGFAQVGKRLGLDARPHHGRVGAVFRGDSQPEAGRHRGSVQQGVGCPDAGLALELVGYRAGGRVSAQRRRSVEAIGLELHAVHCPGPGLGRHPPQGEHGDDEAARGHHWPHPAVLRRILHLSVRQHGCVRVSEHGGRGVQGAGQDSAGGEQEDQPDDHQPGAADPRGMTCHRRQPSFRRSRILICIGQSGSSLASRSSTTD